MIMQPKTALVVPLSALFASLLSGCPLFGGCDEETVMLEQQVELTPEEYAQWQQGLMPGVTGGATTSAAGSTGSMMDSGTPDGSGTADSGAPTTGAGSDGASTGELLSDQEVCTAVCMQSFNDELMSCSVDEQADKVVITCNMVTQCIGGRGHACVRPLGVAAGPDAGAAWLARMAHDEAASVHAFRTLARELAALGAPPELLAELESAALDEVRHAAVTSSLARSHGAEPTLPACVSVPARGLLELAIENAIEGCVHETWAALVAAHQARRIVDPALRRVFAGIAADEARHAELAWTIDAWLSDRLDAADRAKVVAARGSAARELMARIGAAVDEPEILALGVPEGPIASQLCAALGEVLWAL